MGEHLTQAIIMGVIWASIMKAVYWHKGGVGLWGAVRKNIGTWFLYFVSYAVAWAVLEPVLDPFFDNVLAWLD